MDKSNSIEPIYTTEHPNIPIELGQHQVILHTPEGKIVEDAAFTLRLLPSPRALVHLRTSSSLSPGMITSVETPGLSSHISVPPTSVIIDGSGTQLTLSPSPDRTEWFLSGTTPRVREVVFHVLNFFDFHGGKQNFTLRSDNTLRLLSGMVLVGDGWRVTIHSLPGTQRLVEELKAEGGYAITHVGRIERARKGYFTPSRAKAVLNLVRLFLSFARGRFVSCALAAGYDDSKKNWEQWGSHIACPWEASMGWFSGRPASILEDAFLGFCSIMRHKVWGHPLEEIMYWYLRANNTPGVGVDGGIILAQAALEKLAKIYLVDQIGIVSARDFRYDKRTWNAARSIAELLRRMAIPLDIPPELRTLQRIGKRHSWGDGPTAVTEVRNDLVHADPRYAVHLDKPFFEAWQLAQWYVELVILRLAGHMGQYTNRISARMVGETTNVPWV